MPEKTMKTAIHALLFVIAFVVFVLGLGVGLQADPGVGLTLWIVAIAIAALNGLWILRSRTKAGE